MDGQKEKLFKEYVKERMRMYNEDEADNEEESADDDESKEEETSSDNEE